MRQVSFSKAMPRKQVLLGRKRMILNFRAQFSTEEKPATQKMSSVERMIGLESNIASESFKSRWLMAIPAFATHMCIGSPFAWSLMADTITREIGFVAPAAADWTMMEAVFPLSIVFVAQGLSASLVGKWQQRVGARKAMAAASIAFGSGMMLGAAGIHFHSLPLLYLGYGVLGGTGIGLTYTPPIQTLMQWFPDKKGIASGLTIAGFGSGALVFTPLAQTLMKKFAVMPQYLGAAENFATEFQGGKLFAKVDGTLVEVVKAGAGELHKLPYDLAEGLYVVGTGSSGAAEALAVIGAGYLTIMLASALSIRKPHPSYSPYPATVATSTGATTTNATTAPSSTAGAAPTAGPATVVADVSLDDAMRAPQFHLLGVTQFCISTGGMGIFSVAKPMMSEVFSAALPLVVTSAFAGKFLMMLSAGNLGGRLVWAAVSDAIGRRNTFFIFTLATAPIYFSLPTLVETTLASGTALPLYAFCASSALVISIMGGTFAIMPAYEADLFGTKNVGPIHGRMLLYSSVAAVAGPSLLVKLRGISEQTAITDLVSQISPEKFEAEFGTSIDHVSELLAAKAISISKLLVLAPPGTIDPTPHLYDTTMYSLAGLTTAAVLAHALVRPIAQKPIIDVTASVTASISPTPDTTVIADDKKIK